MTKLLILVLVAVASFAQPPSPPSRQSITVKSGASTGSAKTIDFVQGAGVTHSLECVGSVCTLTTSSSASAPAWGQITGTLSNQTDLQNALNGKANTAHTHSLSDLTQSGATSGQVPQWNGSAWVPATVSSGGTGAPNYSQSFTSQTSVVLTHNAGTTNVLVACYNSSDVEIIPNSVTVTNANSVTVTFETAQTGRCVVNSSGGGSGGGSGTVYTANGITGDGSSGSPVRPDPLGPLASQTFYSAALNFGTVPAASCAEKNIAASGASPGLTLAFGWPATLPTNLVGMMYSGANVIVVRLCNMTSSGIAVADGLTYSARIIGGV